MSALRLGLAQIDPVVGDFAHNAALIAGVFARLAAQGAELVLTPELALSGYLDIKGNVWGAIVRDGRGWVDMVTVAADTGDASCRLRAVRLAPQTISSKEGS